MPTIDLNCDMGEVQALGPSDLELLRIVSSANIACGGHAGTVESMRAMVSAAASLGVAVGAHPGYPDPRNFGRVDLECTPAEVTRWVREQVATLADIAAQSCVRLTHVKPHGALYHAAMHRREIADVIAAAAASVDPSLVLVGMAGAPALSWWREAGHRVCSEGFADRRYEPDGSLRSRSKPGAVLSDPAQAAAQAVEIATARSIGTNGSRVAVSAGTICVHGDSPGAAEIARAVREGLRAAGWTIAPPVSS